MELSDAIRAGAKLRPQAFGSAYGTAEDGSLGTCALGAAYEAAGCLTFTAESDGGKQIHLRTGIADAFPVLGERYDEPLPCGCKSVLIRTQIEGIIIHLNDKHRWPREVIAKWVRSIERK